MSKNIFPPTSSQRPVALRSGDGDDQSNENPNKRHRVELPDDDIDFDEDGNAIPRRRRKPTEMHDGGANSPIVMHVSS